MKKLKVCLKLDDKIHQGAFLSGQYRVYHKSYDNSFYIFYPNHFTNKMIVVESSHILYYVSKLGELL